jgi:hypothetical protein
MPSKRTSILWRLNLALGRFWAAFFAPFRLVLKVSVPIRASVLGAAVLLYFDVAIEGSYLFSILACPVWFLASVIKNLIVRPGWRLALFRIAIPALTLGIVLANTNFQWKMGDANGERVVKACEKFHAANGRYPKTLDELVPQYLPSVPRAKYCERGDFWYFNSDGQNPHLWWYKIGFCRKIYNFETKRWHHLD